MSLKNIGAYVALAIGILFVLLFFFKPEIFYRIMEYRGPGGPFVHPARY